MRLKIGDPFVFGRGGEEVLELRERLGVEARVVPGVSACLAAPLAAGVPVTHSGAAHQTLVSTGYGRGNSSSPELPPYDPRRTIVLLMAVGSVAIDRGRLRRVARLSLGLPGAGCGASGHASPAHGPGRPVGHRRFSGAARDQGAGDCGVRRRC